MPRRPAQRTVERAPRGERRAYPIGHFGGFLDCGFELTSPLFGEPERKRFIVSAYKDVTKAKASCRFRTIYPE